MQLIHDHLHSWNRSLPGVRLQVERGTLAKRRWRGIAEDGHEFGFDLEHALADADVFFASASAVYIVEQKPEPVLEVALGASPAAAARLGWIVGNLHFPLAIQGSNVLLIDDSALRQLLEREHIAFSAKLAVFHALSGGHSHSHEHHV